VGHHPTGSHGSSFDVNHRHLGLVRISSPIFSQGQRLVVDPTPHEFSGAAEEDFGVKTIELRKILKFEVMTSWFRA